ncbi:larval/pupal rigid cuticle protein 66-like [Pieris rapae]|uniref:larval/pupal rigid cuticle protein 66-like n=1 Tax=Pieris rapae TaxID=64459 RepID=UPI001E27C563|nr:larval/pupal rigid cuticle protein 66-like [Pieris rapae]
MAAKFIVFLFAVAVAQAAVVVDNEATSFEYGVADPSTGDYKSQSESRVGGVVRGQYSLIEPDGSKRTVDYTADDVNGFNAVVRKDPVATSVVTPVVAARSVVAPVVTKQFAPVTYARSYSPAVVSPVVGTVAPVYANAPVYASAPLVRNYAAPTVYGNTVVSQAYPYYNAYNTVPVNYY